MVTPSISRPTALASAGLFVGPAAWAAHTQAGYAYADVCPGSVATMLALGAIAAAISALGGFVSLRCASRGAAESEASAGALEAPRSVLAAVGATIGFFFAIVIVTQASAALFLAGCAR